VKPRLDQNLSGWKWLIVVGVGAVVQVMRVDSAGMIPFSAGVLARAEFGPIRVCADRPIQDRRCIARGSLDVGDFRIGNQW
jgi:hypothetical protein